MENMFAVWVCKEEDSGWRRDEWYPWAACTTGTELSASWACNETPALRRTINVYLFHFLDTPETRKAARASFLKKRNDAILARNMDRNLMTVTWAASCSCSVVRPLREPWIFLMWPSDR